MFSIETNNIKRSAVQLDNASQRLRTCRIEVSDVISGLRSCSEMGGVIDALYILCEALDKESVHARSLSEAADRIAYKFESCEDRILEVAENTINKPQPANVSTFNYEGMGGSDPSLKGTLTDIDKLIKTN